jgi:hypothetical protein
MKEVQEKLFKFYMNYEDAIHDTNRTFHIVEVEGGIPPQEDIKVVDIVSNTIIYSEEQYYKVQDLLDAVFKFKKVKRETLFGTIFEDVYIFNNYE